jgi:hypothetical protein
MEVVLSAIEILLLKKLNVHEFYKPEEIMSFINNQFTDYDFIEKILLKKEANDGK